MAANPNESDSRIALKTPMEAPKETCNQREYSPPRSKAKSVIHPGGIGGDTTYKDQGHPDFSARPKWPSGGNRTLTPKIMGRPGIPWIRPQRHGSHMTSPYQA